VEEAMSFSAVARSFFRPRVNKPSGLSFQPVRHGAGNLKELRNRIKSVNSIQKITASMKLVAAAKLKQAQENIAESAASTQTFLPLTQFQEVPDAATVKKVAVFPITADRGLCGSINSGLMRAMTRILTKELPNVGETALYIFGEKGRTGLAREYLQSYRMAMGGFDKKKYIPFEDVMEAVDEASKGDFDQYTLVYNHFINLITFRIETKHFPNKGKVIAKDWSLYEFDGEKEAVLGDLYDYYIATNVYGALIDNAAAELSARMSSMENASKNAASMIQLLTIRFNKGRQAAITTELIEIISGAEAFKVEAD